MRNKSVAASLRWMVLTLLVVIINFNLCMAEEGTNTNKVIEASSQAASGFAKKVIDFTNQDSGFGETAPWQIQQGELHFVPTEFTQNRIYSNIFNDPLTMANYTISVNTRWIEGYMYGGYGLIFNYQSSMEYDVFLMTMEGYCSVLRYKNLQWKVLKKWRKKIKSSNLYDTLKIVSQGPAMIFLVNGNKVMEYKDKPVSGEVYVGLAINGYVHASFDDFTVENGVN